MQPKVWVFFYGSYINPDVLREAALASPAEPFGFPDWYVAKIRGFA